MSSFIRPNGLLTNLLITSISTITGIGTRYPNLYSVTRANQLAEVSAKLDIDMRSGGAIGMDSVWEEVYLALNNYAHMDIFLPRRNFNGKPGNAEHEGYYVISQKQIIEGLNLLAKHGIVKDPFSLPDYMQQFFARNVMQVLGHDMRTPTDLVVYAASEDEKGKVSGGTRIAVYLARTLNIPCVNIAKDDEWRAFSRNMGFALPVVPWGSGLATF